MDNTDSVSSASLTGTWYATGMKMWGEDYLQRETQVCIQIGEDRLGDFQFGLVPGSVDGHVDEVTSESRFTFTWEECDEVHPVSKGEWLRLTGDRAPGGIIKSHKGDRSPFQARKAS
ncbi:uncharacterized protein YndB with AHSA1/START domain [Salinibacter ruber]|uniref:hypothetical protein n=1 Tax=Salinibacter ruber TaxID=146919 RepID=UPI0021671BB3|nr:hypothetical protein [Salinibacter ruber]MCS4047563.1 uncharacterized protein YndB with AHSA1/START domain [Salinibacter ruber]